MSNNELEDPLQSDNEDRKLKYINLECINLECKKLCIKLKCKNICCCLCCMFTIIFINYISFCMGIIYKGRMDYYGSLSE